MFSSLKWPLLMGRLPLRVNLMTATENSTNSAGTRQIPLRLDFDAHAAGFARALAHLDRAAIKELDQAGIDPLLRELVRVRASELNGCAYFIDMHTEAPGRPGRRSSACTRCPPGGRLPSSPNGNGQRSPSPKT